MYQTRVSDMASMLRNSTTSVCQTVIAQKFNYRNKHVLVYRNGMFRPYRTVGHGSVSFVHTPHTTELTEIYSHNAQGDSFFTEHLPQELKLFEGFLRYFTQE